MGSDEVGIRVDERAQDEQREIDVIGRGIIEHRRDESRRVLLAPADHARNQPQQVDTDVQAGHCTASSYTALVAAAVRSHV